MGIGILLAVAVLLVVCFLLWLWAIAPAKRKADFREFKKYDYAHRGLHDLEKDAPENSNRAFALAVQGGFGMELDLQLTKDKQVVVHHDHSIKRSCGVDKVISDMTLEELRACRLFGTEEKVPLFTEVLETVGGKTPMIIELKGYGDPAELCTLAMELLKDYKGLYCVESFDPRIVRWFRENRPEIVRGQLMMHMKKGDDGLSRAGAFFARNMLTNWYNRPDFEAYDFRTRDIPAMGAARRLFGIQEVSWTIRSQADYDKARALGNLVIFEKFLPANVNVGSNPRGSEV